MTQDEFKQRLWKEFRKVQKVLMDSIEGDEAEKLAEANHRINQMTNVELIDALTN